jgi:hypothetical protein
MRHWFERTYGGGYSMIGRGRLPAIGGLAGQPSCGRTQCSATSQLVYDHR